VQSTFARQMRQQARQRAKRARRQALLFLPLLAAVFLGYKFRDQLFGLDLPVRVGAAVAFVVLGWAFARDLGRAVGPSFFDRMEPSTAGTVEFVIRLVTLGGAVLLALSVAGLQPQTIAVGGAVTVAVLVLAGQQTLGNVIAGVVLLGARPFHIGDRVRLLSGGLAGRTEGIVASLGLLHTTLSRGDDRILVPNSVVLGSAIVPLREPSGVDLRARLDPGVKPSDLHRLLNETVEVPTRGDPTVDLEEMAEDEVVVRVAATPVDDDDGPPLADQVLSALDRVSSNGHPHAA
jgi:small conductance mechanosensitive channel